MKSLSNFAIGALCACTLHAGAATLVHRYSFSGDTLDSVGGNTGVLNNGATVTATALSLSGGPGAGASVQNMGFFNQVGIGTNFGTTGVTVESWYTDSGSSTWAKLFTFGSAVAGQELAFTHFRGGGDLAPGLDRNGAKALSGYPFGSNTRIPIGEEHHLVVSVAADGLTNLWVDGVQQITNLPTNPLSSVTSNTESIGATAWADPGHFGEVNEFRIYQGTLTDAEVIENLGLGPDQLIPEPGALAILGLASLFGLRRRRA
ncbi:MAG: LamG-like jellyroll fold domain-containing protein [Verrucomicrobiales bacterium]